MTANTDIARLKITLDAVKPPVVRRIEVPPGICLDRLHVTLQVMIGWSNSHLWEFRAGASGWGVPDPDGDFSDEPHDAKRVTLISVLEDIRVKSLEYLYDFGDSWGNRPPNCSHPSRSRGQSRFARLNCSRVTAAIIAKGGVAREYPVEIVDLDSVTKVFAGIERELGPVSLLTNNAGALE